MTPDSLTPPLRVALAQFKPRKGAVEANLARVREAVAGERGLSDIVVFPETCLSGYFLEGGVSEAARSVEDLVEGLGPSTPELPDVVVGFYERWRRMVYNSVAYLEASEDGWVVRHVHRKMFLPTYGVFDEGRFVEPGTDVAAFDTRFGRVGMLVCEDAWHTLPPTILAVGRAELVIVASASPARDFGPSEGGRPGNLERWDRLAPAIASEHGVFVLVSQLAGSEGGKLFPGGSIAVGPDGGFLARGPLLEEAMTRVTLDPATLERARAAAPLLSDLEQRLPSLEASLTRARSAPGVHGSAPEALSGMGGRGAPEHRASRLLDPRELDLDLDLVERTLVEFIREEVQRRRSFERVVVGVSGGVDSAVSLLLACRALGPENVHGFRLPYRTSSPESFEHGTLVLEQSGAHAHTIDISEPVDRYVERYEPDISGLRRGNLMARTRAVVLFDQSAKLDALPLGTGNKSERLLGYFTWHADDSPPINPIGDLFKTQVWALARHLGVPESIVEKPATADLVLGVTDEDEIGVSYAEADPILNGLVHGYTAAEMVSGGLREEAVAVVTRRLSSTHWKRELPTVALLSSSAIGAFYLRPVDY